MTFKLPVIKHIKQIQILLLFEIIKKLVETISVTVALGKNINIVMEKSN